MSPKLRPEVKRAWIEALRSGNYSQTTGVLHREEPSSALAKPAGYCCMGVICEVAKAKGVIRDYTGTAGYPPDDVTEWAYGVDRDEMNDAIDAGRLFWHSAEESDVSWKDTSSFANLNDSLGWTFNQIADHLEANDL